MGTLTIASSAATKATVAEEVKEEDAGRIMTLAKAGAISLARTTGRTGLVRVPGGISLVRIAHRATLAFLRCRHQEGTTTTTQMMGLGASRSLVPSPASWAALKPQRLIASSSSSLVR